MNFEDLQKTWRDQFPVGGEHAAANEKLFHRVRMTERRFWAAVLLRGAADALGLAALAWIALVSAQHGQPFPQAEIRPHREILILISALCIGLYGAALKLNALGSPPVGRDDPPTLAGRLCRDGSRFYALILWRDLRETVGGVFVLFMAAVQACHAIRYAALDWLAVGLLAVAVTGFAGFRFTLPRYRPLVNDTLAGMLAWSIEHTRRQVTMLENILWYLIPVIVAVILLVPIHGAIARGAIHRVEIGATLVFVGAGLGAWRLNRWTARHRLRPRLEALERLQAEISRSGASNIQST
ncbi:MAG TPA: hypothetical protein VHD62_18430 [Opitutaceae bacterium]|nr:hypothetical protein [Opitutaceae bacterium]